MCYPNGPRTLRVWRTTSDPINDYAAPGCGSVIPEEYNEDLFVVEPLTSSSIPLSLRYLSYPRFDQRNQIPSSILLPIKHFCSFHNISFPWPSHMLRNIHDEILPSGPRVSLRHLEWTIPYLDPSPQPITSKYPRHTFMTTLLRCGDGCTQSIPRRWWF